MSNVLNSFRGVCSQMARGHGFIGSYLCIFFFAMVALPTSNCYGQAEPSNIDIRKTIEVGLENGIALAKRTNVKSYALWENDGRSIEYYVFYEQKDLYYGVFYAHLSNLADASLTQFSLGKQPQLMVVLGRNFNSWVAVDQFLMRIGSTLRGPKEMTAFQFKGCNWALFPSKSRRKSAVFIVDTSQTRTESQIERCNYTGTFGIFGFLPGTKAQDIVVDSRTVRLLYSLNDHDREIMRIVDVLSESISAKRYRLGERKW